MQQRLAGKFENGTQLHPSLRSPPGRNLHPECQKFALAIYPNKRLEPMTDSSLANFTACLHKRQKQMDGYGVKTLRYV
jgi:hypothetical protein